MIKKWEEIQELSDKEKIKRLTESLLTMNEKLTELEEKIVDLENTLGNVEAQADCCCDRLSDLAENNN